MRLLISILMICEVGLALAQLPATDLYAVSYSLNGNKGTVRSVRYLSAFNAGGYNNQPFYDGARHIYISTNYYSNATDVARLDLDDLVLERMTRSPESEYSPQPHPGGRSFTTVRVEADSSQTLTAYSLKSGRSKNFAPELDALAYYRWIDDDRVIVTTLPLPMRLGIYDRVDDSLTVIDQAVGRCLQVVDDNLIYYLASENGQESIYIYDVSSDKIELLCPALDDSQDFYILPGDRVLMAADSMVYLWTSNAWMPILDLSVYGIDNITRLAARRGELFIVNKR